MMVNILIIDDEPARAQAWKKEIEGEHVDAGIHIQALDLASVESEIKGLMRRRLFNQENEPLQVDGADILIIDYDLRHASTNGEWVTGAEIAYAARAFSSAKYLILLNQYSTNPFDLTMTRGIRSYADLDIGSSQIANPALWSDKKTPFRPSHWPEIIKEPARFEKCMTWIRENFSAQMLASLGFNTGFNTALNRETLSFLRIDSLDETFEEISKKKEDNPFMHSKDMDSILQKRERLIQISTAITLHWLERVVLAQQDVIVDIPHLIYKMPWLLKDYQNKEQWQRISFNHDPDILQYDIEKYEYKNADLFSRKVFWFNELKSEIAPPEDFDFSTVPEMVFQEDTSMFDDFSNSASFKCDLPTSENTRYISDNQKNPAPETKEVRYSPMSYLLM